MDHLIALLTGLLVGLLGLIVAIMATIEHAARVLLMHLGIGGDLQTGLLAILLLCLIVLAFRWFGWIFGVLIGLLLLLYLAHSLFLPSGAGHALSF